jgi:hypothetical protein
MSETDLPARTVSELYRACRSALAAGLGRASPHVQIDGSGYVRSIDDNLIQGVSPSDFEQELRQGDGNELEDKFFASHSSSALAVNCFAPLKGALSALNSIGADGCPAIHFERKCEHGLGTKPPNLDVLLEASTGHILAIESKCLEPIESDHCAKFSPRYKERIADARRNDPWFHEMGRLVESPQSYRRLHAAQLVKHAFGIAHTFAGRPAALLYLYWEPSNANEIAAFEDHRREIADFTHRIAGGFPAFASLSYRALWDRWGHSQQPEWLRQHVHRIRARYDVAV